MFVNDMTRAESEIPSLKAFWQKTYKQQTRQNWDKFYKRNTTNFFKDRHWLDREFPSLMSKPNCVGLEVGCGVGNLVFPALERNTTLKLFACDFSQNAITLVKTNESFTELLRQDRLEAFVADITTDDPFPAISSGSLDFVTCIFVLSAIPPDRHLQVLQQFSTLLKPGGCICFRDYSVGDLAQQRFQKAKEVPKLEDHLYVRQDGTMSYFFSLEYMQRLVESAVGDLDIEVLEVVERRTTNVKRGLDEARYFLQGVFRKAV